MPFSSLFNRKGSRKNQSKDISGQISNQNTASEYNIKQIPPGESCTDKSEVLHPDWTSHEELTVEGQTCEVIENALVHSEATVFESTQTEDNGNRNLSCDVHSEITTIKNEVVRVEEHIPVKEKCVKNMSPENVNTCGNGAPQHSVEFVDGKANSPDVSKKGQKNSISKHSAAVPISQCTGTDEEGLLKARNSITEQCECASEEINDCDELRALKGKDVTAHESALEDAISNFSQEMRYRKDNNAVPDFELETFNTEKGVETVFCNQKGTPKNPSHIHGLVAANFSEEETITFERISNPSEQMARESVMDVSESLEVIKDFSTAIGETREPKSEDVVVANCCDNMNTVFPTMPAPENSVDSYSLECSENKSFTDFVGDNENERVMVDSQKIPHKKQIVPSGNESTGAMSGLHCLEQERVQETATLKEEVIPRRNNEEHKLNSASEETEEDVGIADSEDPVLEVQAASFDRDEEIEETNSSAVKNSEHDDEEEKEQANEIISLPLLTATNVSSEISCAESVYEESETQTAVGVCHRNSIGEEGTWTKELPDVNDGNTAPKPKILENDSNLREDEQKDISGSREYSEVRTVRSESPVEDSLDSFPSECEDFLGGQRTLMATDPTPSWKVGYLQVKLPVKSRGRGKLKVWRQRWVVIQMDEFVKDTKNPSLMINIYASECSNARRHSALFWCTVTASNTVVYRSQSRTHKYAFSVSVDNDVVLHLAADSETVSQEWMAAIRNLLWPPNPVLQLEKVLHGSDFEVSIIDNEFSFHAGLLGTYGNMKVTSNKLILSHPQTDHVIQEWYLNTLDKFQLLPQSREEDAFKVVVMNAGQDSSTGSGQIILFCPEAVSMLQSIASTIHKLLQYRTTSDKDKNQKELAQLAEWISPVVSSMDPPEDYYKVPRRQIRSLLDIPNFSFEKPLSNEGLSQSQEAMAIKSSMLPSATSASTFSEDSGISMGIQPDDFLNCSITSFTIGGRPVRDHTSSESSDGYSPPCSPEIKRKQQETDAT